MFLLFFIQKGRADSRKHFCRAVFLGEELQRRSKSEQTSAPGVDEGIPKRPGEGRNKDLGSRLYLVSIAYEASREGHSRLARGS